MSPGRKREERRSPGNRAVDKFSEKHVVGKAECSRDKVDMDLDIHTGFSCKAGVGDLSEDSISGGMGVQSRLKG